MPSPVPGMDPYLEQPSLWGGVHSGLISILREMLARQMGPRFFVDSEDHVYILAPDDPARYAARPDVSMVETSSAAAPRSAGAGIAAPLIVDLTDGRVRYPYIQVRDTQDREVVLTLELLSPINKAAGSGGQRDFLRKRESVFHSTSHWIELDLLRAGTPPLAASGAVAYYAALHRTDRPAKLDVWPVTLRDRLPTIAVPLRAPFSDVPLDVQGAVDTLYERYRYDTAIDYRTPPPLPLLSPTDAAWAAERIATWQESST